MIRNPLDESGNLLPYIYDPSMGIHGLKLLREDGSEVGGGTPVGDVLGVSAALEQLQADLTSTLNNNLPNYAVGLIGAMMIAAGVYALTK